MSRGPTKESVSELKIMLKEYKAIAKQIVHLRGLVEQLPKLQEQATRLHKGVVESLEKMDCKSSGNFGYEIRIVAMLGELIE